MDKPQRRAKPQKYKASRIRPKDYYSDGDLIIKWYYCNMKLPLLSECICNTLLYSALGKGGRKQKVTKQLKRSRNVVVNLEVILRCIQQCMLSLHRVYLFKQTLNLKP